MVYPVRILNIECQYLPMPVCRIEGTKAGRLANIETTTPKPRAQLGKTLVKTSVKSPRLTRKADGYWQEGGRGEGVRQCRRQQGRARRHLREVDDSKGRSGFGSGKRLSAPEVRASAERS